MAEDSDGDIMAPEIMNVVASRSRIAVRYPSPANAAFAESSSEAAALPNGAKALTPIIAGSVSGACVVLAWTVSLIVIIIKRLRKRRRFKRLKEAGRLQELNEEQQGPFIVPPDPAVVEGERMPGDAFDDMKKKTGRGVGKGKGREDLQDFLKRSAASERHEEGTEESRADYFTSGADLKKSSQQFVYADRDKEPLRRDFADTSQQFASKDTSAYELTTMTGKSGTTL